MNWTKLTDSQQLNDIVEESQQHPVLIFKHSTRCSISATSLSRVERQWKDELAGDLKPYYLDLIAYRPISSQIATQFGVAHESPQVLVIQNGVCTYHASHFDINFADIAAASVAS